MKSNIRLALIIGSMKSGTTSLHEYLAKHPAICTGPIKEPGYFNSDREDEYLDFFEDLSDVHQYVLDSSTSYTKFPQITGVVDRVLNYGAKAKFIYVVRNPIDRIQSQMMFMKQHFPEYKFKCTDDVILDVSKYHMQLMQYKEKIDLNDLMIIDFNDLKDRPDLVTKGVFSFLGVEVLDVGPFTVVHKTPTVEKKTEESWHSLASRFGTLKSLVPKPIKDLVRRSITVYHKTEETRLTEQDRNELRKLLMDDMLAFQKDFLFDVSKWGFRE